MSHHAKFRADGSNRCGYITVFKFFQDGGRPPSWICITRLWITHAEYLVVFVTVQNVV